MRIIIYYLFVISLLPSFLIAQRKKSIDTSFMDFTVSPKIDFFQFANGKWIKNNPVPKTE